MEEVEYLHPVPLGGSSTNSSFENLLSVHYRVVRQLNKLHNWFAVNGCVYKIAYLIRRKSVTTISLGSTWKKEENFIGINFWKHNI